MAGQPQHDPILHFDVTRMEISEQVHPFWQPSTIVAKASPFNLACTFEGRGIVWQWIKNWGLGFSVSYHVEGIGSHASEVDLGSVNGVINATTNQYGPEATTLTVPANKLALGVYRVACVVTFAQAPGLTGFFENLVIQVY